jgi:hypothetical protein
VLRGGGGSKPVRKHTHLIGGWVRDVLVSKRHIHFKAVSDTVGTGGAYVV